MLVLLVRHAQAAERDSEKYPDDTRRPLTRKGKASHARVTRALIKRGVRPGLILSSPWKRAWQTAEIMMHGYRDNRSEVPLLPAESLADDPDLEEIAGDLKDHQFDTVALVGHEPWMGELASILLTGEPGSLHVDFPKGGVIAVETDELAPGRGALRFFLRPKMI